MAIKNYFMNGTTELLILYLLKKKDRYVYDIVNSFSELSDGYLEISLNTVYTATYKLEAENMISEYKMLVGKKRTRVYYHIEPKGIEYLDKLTEIYRQHTTGVNKIIGLYKEDESQPPDEQAI